MKALCHTTPCERFLRNELLGIMWWEWMRAVLFSAISAWKPGLEMLFPTLPACARAGFEKGKLCPSWAKRHRNKWGVTLVQREYSPEPLRAHITKCSTLRLLCSVSTLHVEATDMERGRHVKWGEWVSVFLFLCVCGRPSWIERLVWVRFKRIRPVSTFSASPISI